MYRDLSAQLAAKEIELTEAREAIAKLDERVRELETQVREATIANRDAVLKGALDDNQSLRHERDELRAQVTKLENEMAAHRRERRTLASLSDDVASAVRTIRESFKK
jgi:archaellum component FlaC